MGMISEEKLDYLQDMRANSEDQRALKSSAPTAQRITQEISELF